ncbi:hypothetical protein ABPG74_009508 [Tetrahymena malaccensis]
MDYLNVKAETPQLSKSKQNDSRIKFPKYNQKAHNVICSFRYADYGLCDPTFTLLQNANELYVDLFFHRVTFELDMMTAHDQWLSWINFHSGFFLKSVYNTYKNSLIDVELLYTAANSTLMYFVPAVQANFSAATYQTCMGNSFIEPFDPRCRGWYQSALKNDGVLFFQQPYVDALSGSVLMTSSIEVVLKDNTKIVYGMDFGITNMIQNIFTPQDVGSDGYTVIFHQNNHTIFHHKLYDVKSGLLLSWEDVEFNATRGEIFSPQQKTDFTSQVNNTIEFMENGSYDILNFINVDQFYQRWEKGDNKYFSLVYPATITMPYSFENPNQFTINILMLGRVSQDITDLIKLVNLNQNPFFLLSIIIETIVMVLIIILFVLHYGALQYNQVEIPITILTQFLQQNYQQQEQNVKITNKGEESKTNENKQIKKSRFYVEGGETSKKIQDLNTVQKFQLEDFFENQNSDMSDNFRFRVDSQFKFSQFTENVRARGDSQYRIIQNKNVSSIRDRNTSKKFSSQQINKSGLRLRNDSQDIKDNYADIKESLNEFLYNSDTSVFKKQNNNSERQWRKENQKVQLKEIDPMFLEMSIILETFQKLESVIQYAISEQNKGSIVNSLMRFSSAKRTFSMIQNNIGLGMCYFNIAQLHLQQDRYEEAIENMFASIECTLQEMNLSSLQELTDSIYQGNLKSQVYNLRILSKRLLGLALVLKENYKKQIKYNYYITLSGDKSNLYESNKYIQICLQIINVTYQSRNLQKYALFVELAENYLLINDYDTCVYYLSISEVFIQNYQDVFPNKDTRKHTSSASPNTIRKNYTEENQIDSIQEDSQFLFRNFSSHSPVQTGSYQAQTSNFQQLSNQYNSEKQTNNQLPDCIDYLNVIVLQNKIQFIQGILTCKESYFYLGSSMLLQTIENYSICDPTVIYSAMVSLQQVFQVNDIDCHALVSQLSLIKLVSQQGNQSYQQENRLSIDNACFEESNGKEGGEVQFDIVVVLSNPQNLKTEYISTQINFLKYLNQKFITPKKDRVSIITYNSVLKIIQPLVIIENKKQLNFCIYQIKNDYDKLIYQQYSGKLQPNSNQYVIDPKVAFIAALNFFRNERATKYLKSQKQMQKEKQLDIILNNPAFKKYLKLKLQPLVVQFKQKYLQRQDSELNNQKRQSDSNLISLQTESVQSLHNQQQKMSFFKLPDNQITSYSFISKGKSQNVQQEIKDNKNNQYIFRNDESKESEYNQRANEQNKISFNQINDVNNPNIFINLNKNQQSETQLNKLINSNSPKIKQQKSFQLEDSIAQSKQSIFESSKKTYNMEIQHDQGEGIENTMLESSQMNSDKINETYMNHFEHSLFKSIKVQNMNKQYSLNKDKHYNEKQTREVSQKNRKQLIVFFSFNDLKDILKNQMFEKISYTDDIEILHCSLQKQCQNQEAENFSELIKSFENKITFKNVNQNYNIFQDIQSLISHVQKLKISKFYKYQLLSSYLGQNF